MKTKIKTARRGAKRDRPNPDLSLFRRMNGAQSRQARAIAYEAALAVIG